MVKDIVIMVYKETQILQKGFERNESLEKIIYDNGVESVTVTQYSKTRIPIF